MMGLATAFSRSRQSIPHEPGNLFSDLSQSKRRPAVVLASAEAGDWILCQVTSKPYADTRAVKLTDYATGWDKLSNGDLIAPRVQMP